MHNNIMYPKIGCNLLPKCLVPFLFIRPSSSYFLFEKLVFQNICFLYTSKVKYPTIITPHISSCKIAHSFNV